MPAMMGKWDNAHWCFTQPSMQQQKVSLILLWSVCLKPHTALPSSGSQDEACSQGWGAVSSSGFSPPDPRSSLDPWLSAQPARRPCGPHRLAPDIKPKPIVGGSPTWRTSIFKCQLAKNQCVKWPIHQKPISHKLLRQVATFPNYPNSHPKLIYFNRL